MFKRNTIEVVLPSAIAVLVVALMLGTGLLLSTGRTAYNSSPVSAAAQGTVDVSAGIQESINLRGAFEMFYPITNDGEVIAVGGEPVYVQMDVEDLPAPGETVQAWRFGTGFTTRPQTDLTIVGSQTALVILGWLMLAASPFAAYGAFREAQYHTYNYGGRGHHQTAYRY
jgi:hypothetical protein